MKPALKAGLFVAGGLAVGGAAVYVVEKLRTAPASGTTGGGTTAPVYTPAWTSDCKTVLLDASGNAVSGVATNAASVTKGGTSSFRGHTYAWDPCPSASSGTTNAPGTGTATIISYNSNGTILAMNPPVDGATQLEFQGHYLIGNVVTFDNSVNGVLTPTVYRVTASNVSGASGTGSGSTGTGAGSGSGGSTGMGGTSAYQAPYTAGWTTECKTVLLDAQGNPIAGPATNAVNPATGGVGSYGGFTYVWPKCPSYKASGGPAPYTASWTSTCKTVLLDAQGNQVAGPSKYAVSPLTGGSSSYGGHKYTWGPCPSAASGGGGGPVP